MEGRHTLSTINQKFERIISFNASFVPVISTRSCIISNNGIVTIHHFQALIEGRGEDYSSANTKGVKTSEGLDFARRGFFHGSGKRRDWIILAGTSVIIRFPGKRLFEPPTFVITYHAPGERSEYGEKWTEWISLDSNNNNNNNNNDLSMILGGGIF